jgi:hypothetical protein
MLMTVLIFSLTKISEKLPWGLNLNEVSANRVILIDEFGISGYDGFGISDYSDLFFLLYSEISLVALSNLH